MNSPSQPKMMAQKDLKSYVIVLALLLFTLSQASGQTFSLSNLGVEVQNCDNSLCLVRPAEEFKKLTESVWKMHKRTQAPDDAKCEKAIFSAYTNNGESATFNITATIQTQQGVTNLLPGKPRIFRTTRIRRGYAKTFQTEEEQNNWTWCLLQFNPGKSYISQMCSTQGDKTFAAIFSFYVQNKDDAEEAVKSISPSIPHITLKLSTYSTECDYDPTGPLTGWGGFYPIAK